MKRTTMVLLVLILLLAVQSVIIVMFYNNLQERGTPKIEYRLSNRQSAIASRDEFNQPISNDTELRLKPIYNSSWTMTVMSSLSARPGDKTSEAQLAIAPRYRSENLSIPTIIIQERADGLLRVEYFAQNWPNTYGLVLYNSTSPGWSVGENLTLKFVRYGPPSQINPELAPRPNGNLTIQLGSRTVLSDFPIAWANLGDAYLYGFPGSSFQSGSISMTFYELKSGA